MLYAAHVHPGARLPLPYFRAIAAAQVENQLAFLIALHFEREGSTLRVSTGRVIHRPLESGVSEGCAAHRGLKRLRGQRCRL